MANYGIPYMGNKSKLCDVLMRNLPNEENFYDLFGGGFAVTHAALVYKKAKYYHYNEIIPSTVELVKKAINGDFNYKVFKPKFIDRDEFFRLKDVDPYIRICWSFGNNQKSYLFSKEIEPYKKALHNAIVFDEFNDLAVKALGFNRWPNEMKHIKNKRLLVRQTVAERNKGLRAGELQRLQQLQRLQRLQQLQQLERLQQLEMTSLDYREVNIKPNSLVYCDPPYKGTAKYTVEFNHNEFYQWCRSAQFPVFISEYSMPEDFKLVGKLYTRSTLAGGASIKAQEKLYCNQYAVNKYLKKQTRPAEVSVYG